MNALPSERVALIRRLADQGCSIRAIAYATGHARATVRHHLRGQRPCGDPTATPHGTLNGYNHYGCRCVSCRAAACLDYFHHRRTAIGPYNPRMFFSGFRRRFSLDAHPWTHEYVGDPWDDPTADAALAHL